MIDNGCAYFILFARSDGDRGGWLFDNSDDLGALKAKCAQLNELHGGFLDGVPGEFSVVQRKPS